MDMFFSTRFNAIMFADIMCHLIVLKETLAE